MNPPSLRPARAADLEAIVRLHATDTLGGHGDVWSEETRPGYEAAFAAILDSADNALFVAVENAGEGKGEGDEVVGVFQITLIPCIPARGGARARIEGVQVRPDRRSAGIGALMMAHAEDWARERGAAFVELGSNKLRADAHRFYRRLGYAQSHEGFKKRL
ncbi:MAG: GNAT family N-acetyltransferase [Salinarimonadaceae bacterium]|nr:MAG: GNAT family N-acetyltransferase [Salinarimonadaceae bacterium]